MPGNHTDDAFRVKKAKVHLGFDLNHSIPRKSFLANGKDGERPFVGKILSPGQTAVLDRGYQAHHLFDKWQEDDQFFVCRIKASTKKTGIKAQQINPEGTILYDAVVLLGTPGVNQSKEPSSINSDGTSRNSLPGASVTSRSIT